MTFESNHSSLLWESTESPLRYQAVSTSQLPTYFDRSLIVPLTLSQRKRHPQTSVLQLPPLKVRSNLTWCSSEEENFLAQSVTTSEQELALFKKKFDRLRASLSQSIEVNRHLFDKSHYKKTTFQQNVSEQDEAIDQLLATSTDLNEKIKKLKNEILSERRKRDKLELQQSKIRRTLTRINQTDDNSEQPVNTSEKERIIEHYTSRINELTKEFEQEIIDRDQYIEELKDELSDEFHYQADEHTKLLRAAERAFGLESQKRDTLREVVHNFEAKVYRAKKPCCIATSNRLSKISTQLRLYSILELALHELFHSSCSCGQFKRSYQTFMRLHQK